MERREVVVECGEVRREVRGRLAAFIVYLVTEPGLAEEMELAESGKLVGSWSGGEIKAWLERYFRKRRDLGAL